MLRRTNIEEENFLKRRTSYLSEKKDIARKAMSLVREQSFIALDVSTTNLAIAKELVLHFQELTVVTNCLTIAQELALNSRFTVLVPPGKISAELFISGLAAVEYIQSFYIDIFFMSISGISPSGGLMDFGFQEFEVKKAMLQSAHQIYAVADQHKFGQHAKIKVCSFSKVAGIITDSGISQEFIDYFTAAEVPFYY